MDPSQGHDEKLDDVLKHYVEIRKKYHTKRAEIVNDVLTIE